jgi:hypothetical protein
MAIKCSQITLPILFSVMIVVMALNYLGFCFFCSYYRLFPPFVMTPPLLTIGYSIWAGLIESLPIGMVATAYVHGEQERISAAKVRSGASASVGKIDQTRVPLPIAMSLLGAMIASDIVSSIFTSVIDQARIFSGDVLSLANFIRVQYFQSPLLIMTGFVFLFIGYRVYDRVFVSE